MSLKDIMSNLPEVEGPAQKKLSFKEKLKWTAIALVLYFTLSIVSLWGLGNNALEQFQYLSVILGASFGSIISLGIGPIVTASIVLQLLNGSGIIKFDLSSTDGKKNFQGVQKLLSIFFIVFEAVIYVFMGGLSPAGYAGVVAGTPQFFMLQIILTIQLCLGGLLILFLDEVVSKWGFGSGISLFIAAGVSKQIFIRALSPMPSPANPEIMIGAIPALFQSLSAGQPQTALIELAAIAATVIVFMIAVYGQAMKIEIPLSFGRVRGHGVRWPLNFAYASVIPVILVSALLANVQLWARLLQNWGHPILGTFQGNTAATGLVKWLSQPQLVSNIIKGNFVMTDLWQAGIYFAFMMIGCVVFSIFWVQTSGMDAKSQAKQIMDSGLQVPGFRRDIRILEKLLARYINPLTVMGGLAIGFLASVANVTGSLVGGTSLLLAVMIIYKLYEDIAKEHMMDMNPVMRKFIKV